MLVLVMLLAIFEVLRSSAALYREFIMDTSDVALFVIIVMFAISFFPVAQNLWRVSFLCPGIELTAQKP